MYFLKILENYKNLGNNQATLSIALAFAVIAISFAAIFIRLSDAPSLTIAFFRLFISLIILTPHLIINRNQFRLLTISDLAGMGISGFFLAGHFYLWITSLEHAPVSVSVILVSVHPAMVALAGYFFLGDKIPKRFFLSMTLVLMGTAAIASESITAFTEGSTELRGAMMALGGAAMMAGYLLVGRRLRQSLTTTIYVSGTYSAAAFLLFLTAIITRTALTGYPVQEYLLFIALAIIPTLLGHTVFNWALKKVRASLISLLYLGEPLGATLLAFFILRELPTNLQASGSLIILIGLYLVIKSESSSA